MREPNPYSSLEAGIVRIPRDDGDPDVSGQLEEILRGCNCPAEMLTKNNTIVTTIRKKDQRNKSLTIISRVYFVWIFCKSSLIYCGIKTRPF